MAGISDRLLQYARLNISNGSKDVANRYHLSSLASYNDDSVVDFVFVANVVAADAERQNSANFYFNSL